MHLIDNWKTELHRLWSMQITLFFAVLNGVALGLAAFVDVFNPWLFMGLNVCVYVLIAVVRMIKQDKPDDAA